MARLEGCRVLVIEDEALVAMLIEDALADAGCTIVGTHGRLEAALHAAGSVEADLAVLDVNLAGSPSYPVAEALRARGIPFVFTTGYGVGGLRDDFATVPVVVKPFTTADLERALVGALAGR